MADQLTDAELIEDGKAPEHAPCDCIEWNGQNSYVARCREGCTEARYSAASDYCLWRNHPRTQAQLQRTSAVIVERDEWRALAEEAQAVLGAAREERDAERARAEAAEARVAELERLREQRHNLASFLRTSWNSAHAQHDLASSEGLKREYDGRIAAIERVAEHLGVALTEPQDAPAPSGASGSEGEEVERG